MNALAGILLATPHINNRTLLHELRCWNGENLFQLLFLANSQDKQPVAYIGTDINQSALHFAETARNLIGIKHPHVQFHLSNALHATNFSSLQMDYNKEIKLALRLIAVLEPKDVK